MSGYETPMSEWVREEEMEEREEEMEEREREQEN